MQTKHPTKGQSLEPNLGARRAAEQGYSRAQADLAYMYEQGRGVPLDYVAAYSWYTMAVAGGEHHSASRLKSLARQTDENGAQVLHHRDTEAQRPALKILSLVISSVSL